jgi:16S rRNA (uracil1498-N3)-methyltransferase
MPLLPLRALPRVFVPGASATDLIELPQSEVDKFRKVLRLSAGAHIAVLPNDGSVIRCEFTGRDAKPIEVEWPDVEPELKLTVAQALPKGDKLDEIVRACSEIGVEHFILFPSERTIVQWDEKKVQSRLQRLAVIAREAAEVSFRTKMPTVEHMASLGAVLKSMPDAAVLSESDQEFKRLKPSPERVGTHWRSWRYFGSPCIARRPCWPGGGRNSIVRLADFASGTDQTSHRWQGD